MNCRLTAFRSLATDAFYGKLFKRLKPDEVQKCEDYIIVRAHLDKDQFGHEVNRWGLDETCEKNEKVRQSMQWELVSVANTRAYLNRSK